MKTMAFALLALSLSARVADAQTPRIVPQTAPAYSAAALMQSTVPEYPVNTPLMVVWDYTDAQIPDANEFRVAIDAHPQVPAGTPMLGVNVYRHNLSSVQLTAGLRTITVSACNEEGCASVSTQVRIRRLIPSPPGNPRVSPQQQARLTEPIPPDRAVSVAVMYSDLAYDVRLRPEQVGVIAPFHPASVPTTWSVIQAVDRAAEAFLPAPAPPEPES